MHRRCWPTRAECCAYRTPKIRCGGATHANNLLRAKVCITVTLEHMCVHKHVSPRTQRTVISRKEEGKRGYSAVVEGIGYSVSLGGLWQARLALLWAFFIAFLKRNAVIYRATLFFFIAYACFLFEFRHVYPKKKEEHSSYVVNEGGVPVDEQMRAITGPNVIESTDFPVFSLQPMFFVNTSVSILLFFFSPLIRRCAMTREKRVDCFAFFCTCAYACLQVWVPRLTLSFVSVETRNTWGIYPRPLF